MLLLASLAWALPDAVYDGTWPRLSPDGERVAWLRGVAAPRRLCVTPVATPDACAEGPEAAWARWLDDDTVVIGTPTSWATVETGTGTAATHALAQGARVHAVLRDGLVIEGPPGTFTRVDPAGTPRQAPYAMPARARPLLDEAGEPVGSLRYQKGAEPAWVEVLDAEGRRVATRWLWDQGEAGRWSVRSSRATGGVAYAVDRAAGDHGALERVDLSTRTVSTVFAPDEGLLSDVLLGLDGEPDAVASTWARTSWTVLDPSVQADFDWLAAHVAGDVLVDERSADDARWLLTVAPGGAPTYAAVYDRAARRLLPVPPHNDGDAWPWAPTEAFEVATRDALPITSYLTRPDPARFPGLRPLVVALHGGPWSARYRWGFDPEAQRYADRGWATLRVNFRGSGWHGRPFGDAGRGAWVDAMRTDVYDAAATAVRDGVADAGRVALVGGSYGGYATLAAAVFAPEVARCGVSFAGPPNVPLGLVRGLRLGDLGRIQLGPHADRVGFPLLLVSGDADRLVPVGPVRRFAARAHAAGRAVTLVTVTGEGHEASREAWDAIRPAVDRFLATCFGEESPRVDASPRLVVEVDGAGVFGRPRSGR